MSSKSAQSGLRTLKRDFSAASSSSHALDLGWPSSPPPAPVAAKPLTGAQKRLKDIEDALKGIAPQATTKPAAALNASKAFNKRPSDTAPVDSRPAPGKKQRTQDVLAPTNFTRTSSSSAVRTKPVVAAASSAPHKVAKVFLSAEQKAILKLVSEGNSVFYTGSAGAFRFLTRIYAPLVNACVKELASPCY